MAKKGTQHINFFIFKPSQKTSCHVCRMNFSEQDVMQHVWKLKKKNEMFTAMVFDMYFNAQKFLMIQQLWNVRMVFKIYNSF